MEATASSVPHSQTHDLPLNAKTLEDGLTRLADHVLRRPATRGFGLTSVCLELPPRAIPDGDLAVAASIARGLALRPSIAVIDKMTLPLNTKGRYGAVRVDGTIRLNLDLTRRLPVGE